LFSAVLALRPRACRTPRNSTPCAIAASAQAPRRCCWLPLAAVPTRSARAASTLSVCTRAPWLAALGASDMPQVVTAGELAVVAHELEDVPFCHARVHVSQIQAAVRLAHRLPRGPASTLARQRRPRTPHRTHGAAHTRERETMAGARSTQGSVLRAGSPQPRPRAPRTFSACTVPIGPREKGAPLPCDSPPRPPRPAIPFLFRRKSSI